MLYEQYAPHKIVSSHIRHESAQFPWDNYVSEQSMMEAMTREEVVSMLKRNSTGFSRGYSRFRGVTSAPPTAMLAHIVESTAYCGVYSLKFLRPMCAVGKNSVCSKMCHSLTLNQCRQLHVCTAYIVLRAHGCCLQGTTKLTNMRRASVVLLEIGTSIWAPSAPRRKPPGPTTGLPSSFGARRRAHL